MSGSTITTLVPFGITLGAAGFTNPLTIASTGSVHPTTGSGQIGVLVSLGIPGSIADGGSIEGAFGGNGANGSTGGAGGNGAAGISFATSGVITEVYAGGNGAVGGGSGGYGGRGTIASGAGGAGGAALVIGGGASVTSSAKLYGGGGSNGGVGYNGVGTRNGGAGGAGGAAGAGVLLGSGAVFTNLFSIQGGIGGKGGAGGGYGISSHSGASGHGALGGAGIVAANNATILNQGFISGGRGGYGGSPGLGAAGGDGVDLASGASLLNSAALQPSIFGGTGEDGGKGGTGVSLAGGATVTNQGLIEGGVADGIGAIVNAGAIFANLAQGTLAGGTGGFGLVLGAAASMTNDGRIAGGYSGYHARTGGIGASIGAGAMLTNAAYIAGGAASYYGPGGAGVLITGGTLVDAGTIAGGPTAAAVTLASSAGRLVLDPGATLLGDAIANPAYANVLELAAGTGTGTLGGIGSVVSGFRTIAHDAGASWQIAGSAAGFASGPTLTGFGAGETVQIDGFVASGYRFVSGTGLLLTSAAATVTIDVAGALTTGDFHVTASGGNTDITACFATGTRIAMARGQVAVEALGVGELVLTLGGRLAPVAWIGHRRTDLRRHTAPHDVMPVRVTAGAFGPDLPRHDIVLSPDHAVFVDGALCPVRHLVNGVSIVQERRDHVTYWHVELDRHDLILAEGLACESYLDTGNRGAFENADGPTDLHPDFARAAWAEAGCAAILTDPADHRLRAAHTRLLARACSAQNRNTPLPSAWRSNSR